MEIDLLWSWSSFFLIQLLENPRFPGQNKLSRVGRGKERTFFESLPPRSLCGSKRVAVLATNAVE